nr:[FeFe] hydrogenase H-cluster maturation GTPase HydF [uncultured Agathobaculum sp.]
MGMNDVVSAERPHIAFFGLRNAGKSSVVNAVTGQKLSVVSAVKGTTTDPVQKAMELLPAGPVVVIDTPGIDDTGALGEERVQRARRVLDRTDIAILVVDSGAGMQNADRELLDTFRARKIAHLVVFNKCDLLSTLPAAGKEALYVSAIDGTNIGQLKERIAALACRDAPEKQLVADLLSPGDLVVLVVPIDDAAPKERLILPQQQTIRDILDAGAISVVTGVEELPHTLSSLRQKPRLVITDSQAFSVVSRAVPPDIQLTSFSILFARYKGSLRRAVQAAAVLSRLREGDSVLISEGCTHHRQCGDIGTIKLPNWIRQYAGCEPRFVFTSGREFPDDLTPYSLVLHCGGCMLSEREMHSRGHYAAMHSVPMTNYGIAIAQMHGILARSLEPFPDFLRELTQAQL